MLGSMRRAEHDPAWGNRVRALMKRGGFNQSSFALTVGVNRGAIHHIHHENWIPPRDVVERIIERFNLPRQEWLDAAGYPDTHPARGPALAEELTEICVRLSKIAKELSQSNIEQEEAT